MTATSADINSNVHGFNLYGWKYLASGCLADLFLEVGADIHVGAAVLTPKNNHIRTGSTLRMEPATSG